MYSGHILRKACFPRRGEAVLGGDYVVSLPEEKQRRDCPVSGALPFQTLTSGSLAGSGPRLSLPVAVGFSAVGSYIPLLSVPLCSGEGTLGIPALARETWLGWRTAPLLSSLRDLPVAWQAGWGCIGGVRPRLPWSVRGSGLRPNPLITGAATLASSLLAWVEGFPHLFGFLRPPVSFLLDWGFVISSPSLLNVSQPFWVWGSLPAFCAVPLAAASKPTAVSSALARSCCSRAVQRMS